MVDLSRCRLAPFEHQVAGIQALLRNPFFFLADEMGAGKSLQAIVAAQMLFTESLIDRVLVIAPASVRPVWFDPELGELKKHLWDKLPAVITEFHAKKKTWVWHKGPKPLEWLITNYEFIRSKQRLAQLMAFCTPRTLLILDESSAIKTHTSQQTKACVQLRWACGRVVLLNGTPIANSPMDMYAQGQIMSRKILEVKSYYHFRARYAVMGGWQQKQVIGYQNLEDLQNRFKPYVLRRLKRDCLKDLPEPLEPIIYTVSLTEETWRVYKDMRDEMVAWLTSAEAAITSQAGVKALRLAQITSGFVGGVDADGEDFPVTREVGREKLDFVLEWWKQRLIDDPTLKLLVWCRFKPELMRLMTNVAGLSKGFAALGQIHGGQKPADREAALRLLDPRTAPPGPVFMGGTYGTGSLGLNFTACHTVVNLSYDFSYWKFLQSAARVDRPGQRYPVSYFDVVATGPQGQKTLDHQIIKARRAKESIANWTTAAWIKKLIEE